MATNFASIQTNDPALRSTLLAASTALAVLLVSLGIAAAMQSPVNVDETAFEAGATAVQY
jgi:hypothetical protein